MTKLFSKVDECTTYIPTSLYILTNMGESQSLYYSQEIPCWPKKTEPPWTSLLKKGMVLQDGSKDQRRWEFMCKCFVLQKCYWWLCAGKSLVNIVWVSEIKTKTSPCFNKTCMLGLNMFHSLIGAVFIQIRASSLCRLPVLYIKLSALLNNDRG